MYYTTNIEAPSIRLVLHETAQRRNWGEGVSSMDIATVFLNAKMPTTNSKDVVYVIPPRILVHFGFVAEDEVWMLLHAVYGLRVSPRLWGEERDRQLESLRLKVNRCKFRLAKSTIDTALWTIHEDTEKVFLHQIEPVGFLLTYVDDFLIAGPTDIRACLEEEISQMWKTKTTGIIDQLVDGRKDSGESITFLSAVIRAYPK